MKKNYFMLAAAALMFAACAETDFVNPVPENEGEVIGFETYAQLPTRAENSQHSNYSWDLSNHHITFDVWAYKSVSNDFVFTKEQVSWGTAWTYTGLAYWDKAASSYEFYAAAPSSSIWTINRNAEATHNDDYFTINSAYTVTTNNACETTHEYVQSFKTKAPGQDLMIAAPKNVPNSAFGTAVQLEFNHILSRLNVTVSKDATLSGQTVTLKSLTFHNINNEGTFAENTVPTAPATLATGTHERWSLTSNVITYNALTEEELEIAPISGDAEYMLQSLIMPQLAGVETVALDGSSNSSLTEPFFTITYTIEDSGNSESFTASYNLAAAFGKSGSEKLAFNEGWQNTLNITIKPAAIEFNGKVAEWGAGLGSSPLI